MIRIRLSGNSRRCIGTWALLVLFACPSPLYADPDEWISRAESFYERGDYKGALESFQRASWERPQDAVLHYNMAVLAETLGHLDSAVDSYLAYLRWNLHSEDRDAVKSRVFQLCGKLGSTAYSQQDWENAAYWYKKAGKLFPRARAVHYNLGKVYEAMGDFRRAAMYVEEYRTLSGPQDRTEALRWLASLHVRQAESSFHAGQIEDARASFQEARKWNDNDPAIVLGLARCEERLGLLDSARDRYARFLEMAPESQAVPEVRATLGRIFRIQAERALRDDDTAKAEALLLRGLERNPDDGSLHQLLAKIYLKSDRPVLAVSQLEDVCRLTPAHQAGPVIRDLVELSLVLADKAYQDKDYRSAALFLNTAQFWDPDNPVLAYNLAQIHDRRQDVAQAIQSYRKYLSLRPQAQDREEIRGRMAYLYFVVGSDFFRTGSTLAAQDAFEQALLLRPHDPALLYNLALVLRQRGDTSAAIHFFERYMQYESDPAEIQRIRSEVAALRGTLSEEPSRPRPETAPQPTPAMRDALPGQDDTWMSQIEPRGQAYRQLRNGRWTDAVSSYEQHLRRFPLDRHDKGLQEEVALAYREQGRSALLQGQTSRALASLQMARQWSPSDASSYLWEGDLHENLRDTHRALQIYRESLRAVSDPVTRNTFYRKIVGLLTRDLQTALAQQDYEQALSKLIEMEPYLDEERKRDVQYQAAQLKAALGRPAEALVHYGLHLHQAPGALNHPGLAEEISRVMGSDRELESVFEDPEGARALGLAATQRGDHARALFFLLTARGRNPGEKQIDRAILGSLDALPPEIDPLALLFRGSSFSVDSLSDETEKQAWLQRGLDTLQSLRHQGLYEEGLRTITLLEAAGSKEDFALMKAFFHEKLGQGEEAMVQYRLALRPGGPGIAAHPSPAHDRLCDLLVHYAIQAYDQGQQDRARLLLQEAEALSPQRRDVAFNLGCIHLREKELQKALDAFSRYVSLTPGDSPRKILTERALETLGGQIAASAGIRYGDQGATVDLVFEQPATLGGLLDSGNGAIQGRSDRRVLLDDTVLAPYMEQPMGEDEAKEAVPLPWAKTQ